MRFSAALFKHGFCGVSRKNFLFVCAKTVHQRIVRHIKADNMRLFYKSERISVVGLRKLSDYLREHLENAVLIFGHIVFKKIVCGKSRAFQCVSDKYFIYRESSRTPEAINAVLYGKCAFCIAYRHKFNVSRKLVAYSYISEKSIYFIAVFAVHHRRRGRTHFFFSERAHRSVVP